MQQKTRMHTCAKIIVQDHLHWAHGSSQEIVVNF